MSNGTGIKGYHFVEFYVGSAKQWAYWLCRGFGFEVTGFLGPETGYPDRVSYYLTKNNLRFVISSSVRPSNFEIAHFVAQHGDGVKRWAVKVENVQKAFEYAFSKGGIPVRVPQRFEDEFGYVEEAAIKLYDDAEVVFINSENYTGVFRPGYQKPRLNAEWSSEDTGLLIVDHIVGNVRRNEMNVWVEYLNNTLDMETFIDFGPGDIATDYSALLSKVVRTRNSVIRNPVNEPYIGKKKSQIEEYIQEFIGTGIQHIALRTNDILSTIKILRKNGVEFLETPDSYYALLKERKIQINENIDDLKALRILCDTEGNGYLLQIFTKPICDRPTVFFEIIQRVGESHGFGKGNFQALFESIEREQELRGNL